MGYSKDNLETASLKQNKLNKLEDAKIQQERTCTDLLFCGIFMLFVAGMVILSGVAFSQGDPYRISTPFDSHGFRCGENLP
jgi:hypothetical protein